MPFSCSSEELRDESRLAAALQGLRKNATVPRGFSGHTGATLALADVFAKTDKDRAADFIAELRAGSANADASRRNSFRELPGRHPAALANRVPCRSLMQPGRALRRTWKTKATRIGMMILGLPLVMTMLAEATRKECSSLRGLCASSDGNTRCQLHFLCNSCDSFFFFFQSCCSFAVHRGVCSLPRFCLLMHMLPSSHRNAIIPAVWIVASAQMAFFFLKNLGLEDHDGYGDADIEEFDHQTNLVGCNMVRRRIVHPENYVQADWGGFASWTNERQD